ncbi:MAG: Phytanoyl-CoA dioxygenase (PhyH) family [Ilumatobacteraceae bacterium]|nr:Phytanoyl-CoA dioxygenase (PhyH) family [Ilumatobacteraceae bacterium]MCU1388910.1 Phytanoyl-CoA dioxygenase (PhyH) family [Ilumatobacteraceae bacterium]
MLKSLVRRLPEPIKAPIRRRVVAYGQKVNAPAPLSAADHDHWKRNGYLIMPQLFAPEQVARGAAGFDEAWATRRADDRSLVIDAYVTGGTQRRMHLADAPDEARSEVYKLNDLYLVDDVVRSMILAPALLSAMRELVGDDVVAINSLHFERGSTQQFHVDTYYMPPPPGGQLIVSSICLEDVHADAGPLQYYPGSHLIDPFLNDDGDRRCRNPQELAMATDYFATRCAEHGLEPTTFLGRAGDTFLWHEQLLHGGSAIVDMARTRRSIVTHYWTKSTMPPDDLVVAWGAGHVLQRNHAPVPA